MVPLEIFGQVLDRFADDLDSANYGVLELGRFYELLSSFALRIILYQVYRRKECGREKSRDLSS